MADKAIIMNNNWYEIKGELAFIPLRGARGAGKTAIVLASDIPRIAEHSTKWSAADEYGRAQAQSRALKKKVLLHRVLVGEDNIAKGEEVDHIDRNPLNNLPSNLRLVTKSTNNRNQRIRGATRSRGVDFRKHAGKYRARIQLPSNKEKHLGYFSTEEAAAAAYRKPFEELYPDEVAAVFAEGVKEGVRQEEARGPKQMTINHYYANVQT